MLDRRLLGHRLRQNEPTAGLLVKMPACRQIAIAGAVGFDYVIVDAEHGAREILALEDHMRAAQAASIAALVRVPGADPAYILAAMDAGATGIVIPHVADPTAAAAAVSAAHYPPLGSRGFALSTPAAAYGTSSMESHLERSRSETCVIVQVEDEQSLELAADIARVDGVTALFAGIRDLTVAAGWTLDDPETQRRIDLAVRQLVTAVNGANVGAMVPIGVPTEARRWREAGIASVVMVDTDLMLASYRDAASAAAAVESGEHDSRQDDEPVLLLGGMFCNDSLWNEVCSSLRASVRTIPTRIDLDESVDGMAESVLAVAPDHFALVGHSLGGIVALEILRRQPERVSRLALLNTSARAPTEEQCAQWAAMEDRVRTGDFENMLQDYAQSLLSSTSPVEQAHLRTRVTAMARAIGRDGVVRQLQAQRARQDMRDRLAELRCPTLVVASSEDDVSPPELQSELADAIPGADFALLGQCGHMSPLEQPAVLASLIDNWLELAPNPLTPALPQAC